MKIFEKLMLKCVIPSKGVILLNTNNDHLVIKVIWKYRPLLGSYLASGLCLNIFFRKCTSQSLTLLERIGLT